MSVLVFTRLRRGWMVGIVALALGLALPSGVVHAVEKVEQTTKKTTAKKTR